jgi:hypothetical protein
MEAAYEYSYEKHKALREKFYPSRPVVPTKPTEKLPEPEQPIVRDIINLTPEEPEEEIALRAMLDQVWTQIYGENEFLRKTAFLMKGFSGRQSARYVIAKVLVKHGMTFIDIAGQAKSQKFVDCRFEIYYRLRRELGLSLMQVGRMLNKDHTSVLHGYRRMEEKIANGLKLD